MTAPTDWKEWSQEAVELMRRRNEAWQDRHQLSGASYRWDLDVGCIRFETDGRAVQADITVIGTLSTCEGTFLWAWANTFPAPVLVGLDTVREFGHTHDLTLLTTAEWPGGRAELLEMVAVSGRILDGGGVFVDTSSDLTIGFVLRNLRQIREGKA